MTNEVVLLASDDAQLCNSWQSYLRSRGYEVHVAGHAGEATSCMAAHPADIAILDWDLPPDGGEYLALEFCREYPQASYFLFCGFVSGEMVERARALGAVDCLELTGDIGALWADVEQAIGGQVEAMRPEDGPDALRALVGGSPSIVQLRSRIRQLAQVIDPVLIVGESGTGKELVARALHSLRCSGDQRFEAVNCAGIPEELLESALFGHVKGAFTGASYDRKGSMQLAGQGTLFLDEIGDMSAALQAKLLRAIEERKFRPVGGDRDLEFQGRIVCATNKDLAELNTLGEFREDLYYRIAVHTIVVSPLRERKDDVPVLVEHFVAGSCGDQPKQFSDDAMRALEDYPFPGNVRELSSLVRQASLTASHRQMVMRRDLPEHVLRPRATGLTEEGEKDPFSLTYEQAKRAAVERFQREYLAEMLRKANGNQTRAAKLAGMNRASFCRLAKMLGLIGEAQTSPEGGGENPGSGK